MPENRFVLPVLDLRWRFCRNTDVYKRQVYDYADGTGYDLSDRGNFDYILTVQEDSLIAEKGLIRRMRSLSPASWCCWMAFFR